MEVTSPLSLVNMTLVRLSITKLEGLKSILDMLGPLLERPRAHQFVEYALGHWMSPSGARKTGFTRIL